LDYRYPYEPLQSVASKMSVSDMKQKLSGREYSCSARPGFLSAKGLTPAQRGVALHEFLQFCDFNQAQTDLDAEITRMERQKFLLPEQIEALDRQKLAAFFASKLYRRIQAAQVLREQRFTCELPAGQLNATLPENMAKEKVVLQGVADLVLFEPDGLVVVDYKTDRVKSEAELITRYTLQLEIYSKALAEIFEQPVKECVIYSFQLEKEIALLGFA